MKKLLPVFLALMLAAPAFAAAQTSDVQSSTYSLSLSPFLDIQKLSEKTTTNVTFDDNYTNLNLAEALSTNFRVYTNDAEQKIYLYASAGSIAAKDAPALYGEAGALKLIFGNISTSDGSVAAKAEDIKNVIANPLQSKNAFALDLTPKCVVSSVTPNGAVSDPTATLSDDGIVTYSMTNGIYDMSYTTGLKAVDNSFNTYDTKGQYQAILTLSKTSI